MTQQLHDSGEEWIIKYVFTNEVSQPNQIDIGLYDDSADNLSDSDDIGAISTEPSTGNYARQSASYGTSHMTASSSSGDWLVDINDQKFDTTDTTESVDSYFVEHQVQLDGDGSATEHLLWTGSLGGTYDLSNYSDFTIKDAGGSID